MPCPRKRACSAAAEDRMWSSVRTAARLEATRSSPSAISATGARALRSWCPTPAVCGRPMHSRITCRRAWARPAEPGSALCGEHADDHGILGAEYRQSPGFHLFQNLEALLLQL